MYFCVTCTTVGELLYPILRDVDLIEATETISDILGASMVVLKFTIIIWRRRDLYRLLKSAHIVRSKMVVKETDPKLKALETKSHKEASIVTMIMLVLIGGTIAAYNINFLFCIHLESIFSPCILVQFVLSGVTLSLVAFQVTLDNVGMDRKVKYMQFFFLIVGSLFVYCWYGEKISKESKSIGDSLYNTDWYNMTKEFKYLVIQMIFRSQKPVYITAWGFINATLQSYTAVLKTSVSYFALLRTLGSDDDVQV
ncbi:odorant receptor 13a-like [Chrysoperla carnea]|uniref:odorant receptor 13a-like n=1 Tax=Chrysoperla carnea TaxID=189513 RepID=UPI001D093133|nr:odorant receptor 13a-like [Chrysoperla carnea]